MLPVPSSMMTTRDMELRNTEASADVAPTSAYVPGDMLLAPGTPKASAIACTSIPNEAPEDGCSIVNESYIFLH